MASSCAKTPKSAELALQTQAFGVAVLDIGLPGKSGLELLKSMRRAKCEVPVLILTARFAPPDRVLGLDLGADDYMVKPFDLDELLARLRSIIRRGQGRAMRCRRRRVRSRANARDDGRRRGRAAAQGA